MQLEPRADLLTEVTIQHLPTIRWFKSNWMDLVFETNKKGECVEFSIFYREVEDNFNIEWNGNQFFFSQNESNLNHPDSTLKEAIFLIENFGEKVPVEVVEFITSRLSTAISF